MTRRPPNAGNLSSFVGLVGARAARVVASALTGGLHTSGTGAWCWSTPVVWIGMIAASLLSGRRIPRRLTGRDRGAHAR